MIRALLCLVVLLPADLASAQYEVIPPVYRKPEMPPPPATGPTHVPPMIDVAQPCRKPVYPDGLTALGVVDLQVRVEADGHVSDSRILQSSGSIVLDEAARSALMLCHYKPGTIDGQPESAWARLRYRWEKTDR